MPDLFQRLPKYVQIKEALRDEIKQGFLKNGQQLASEASLIERFNASKMTVIRALQELVQEGYLRRIQGKGTFVTIPKQDTSQISVLLPSSDSEVYSTLLQGIQFQAIKWGYEINLCYVNDQLEHSYNFVQRQLTHKTSGFIAAIPSVPIHTDTHQWFQLLQQHHAPLVIVDGKEDDFEDIPTLHIDGLKSFLELMQAVIHRGHKRILLVLSTSNPASPRKYIEVFRQVSSFEKMKLEVADEIFLNEGSDEGNLEILQTALFQYDPTALITLHDYTAIKILGLFRNIHSFDLSNISVTGMGDLTCAKHAGLTTIRFPRKLQGMTAVDLLHQYIQNNHAESVTLPSEIVYRTSLVDLNNDIPSIDTAMLTG